MVLGLVKYTCSIFQNYLRQYNYISPTRNGNHDVKTAIERFQEFFHLPISGKLDAATLAVMKKPRCGVQDVDDEGRVKRFATLGKWKKNNHLKFYVQVINNIK